MRALVASCIAYALRRLPLCTWHAHLNREQAMPLVRCNLLLSCKLLMCAHARSCQSLVMHGKRRIHANATDCQSTSRAHARHCLTLVTHGKRRIHANALDFQSTSRTRTLPSCLTMPPDMPMPAPHIYRTHVRIQFTPIFIPRTPTRTSCACSQLHAVAHVLRRYAIVLLEHAAEVKRAGIVEAGRYLGY